MRGLWWEGGRGVRKERLLMVNEYDDDSGKQIVKSVSVVFETSILYIKASFQSCWNSYTPFI